MSVRLKPLEDQVVVLTGASSGIGLATARMAVARGARVVLAARNADALRALVAEFGDDRAHAVPVDVGDEDQVQALARAAIARFGGFDTWVNNAGGSIYGDLIDIATADHRRLFDTNFWGVVYGSVAAARHFRDKPAGRYAGALVNVGSVLSDRAVPVQGMYCASKFAVKGYTEALRMELEEAGVPVSVTLVKPSAIDTPFPRHARNYLDEEPTLPPPLYKPDVVAKAILHCAETPERDITVGGGGKAISLIGAHAPRLSDRVMEATMRAAQKKGEAPRNPAGTLHEPTGPELEERGDYSGPVMGHSAYTAAALHPWLTAGLAVTVGFVAAALLGGSEG